MKTIFSKAGAFLLVLGAAAVLMTSCKEKTGGENTSVDKTKLEAAITNSETLLTGSEGNYTEQSIKALEAILKDAKAINASVSATQAQVDQITSNLTKANEAFSLGRYQDIPAENILTFFDFNSAPVDGAITSTGTKSLKAVLSKGPQEIFGNDTALPTFAAGVDGNAVNFTKGSHLAINEYTPNDFLQNKMSWSFWVNTTNASLPGNYVISLNYWNNWKINIENNGKPFFTVKTTQSTIDMDNEATGTVQDNKWVHIAITMDLSASTVTFYVNGEVSKIWTTANKDNLKGTIAPAYQSPLNVQLPMLIGASTTYAEAEKTWVGDGWVWNTPETWSYFEGAIDNLGIYNTALNSGQIARLYQDQKPS